MIQDRFVDLSSLCFIMNIFYVLLDTNGASERLFVKFTKAKQFWSFSICHSFNFVSLNFQNQVNFHLSKKKKSSQFYPIRRIWIRIPFVLVVISNKKKVKIDILKCMDKIHKYVKELIRVVVKQKFLPVQYHCGVSHYYIRFGI